MSTDGSSNASDSAKWQPLNSRQRRVLGVMVEKAKTVPDSYPMTLNALVNGCNQKSNREPQMELSEDEVQEALEELRAKGAASEVQGSGRVSKFKHHAYEWLGVDKFEIAVMTELLLRGEQTLGELRGRAARMEPIADLGALQNILKSLLQKKLIIELTPPGRGQLVTHNLYKERELTEIRAEYAGYSAGEPQARGGSDDDDDAPRGTAPRVGASTAGPAATGPAPTTPRPAPASVPSITADMLSEIRLDVAELRAEVARLRQELRDLDAKFS